MSVPTEAEIREAVERAWDEQLFRPDSTSIGFDLTEAFDHCGLLASSLYDEDEFRKSEEERFSEIVSKTVYPVIDKLKEQARRKITAATIAAVTKFAAEYPDAPRATKKAVAA